MLRSPLVVILLAVSGVAAAQPTKPVADPTTELVVEYQRVGHELVLLQNHRGRDAAKDLWLDLHTIDLDKGLMTPEGRANAALTLAEIHDKVERRHGVEISKACQHNPIAAGCE